MNFNEPSSPGLALWTVEQNGFVIISPDLKVASYVRRTLATPMRELFYLRESC